ncbi:MAG TPA: hypothetical protein DCE41_05510 [Cytophagales bacterium]|nr:hypothetical protein [Cytophagales bacterium]HAA20615.1 hypothetical protein [Cytophagales bacterium]HAP58696.1 hypothetical protein [Cytophagales bacterium]
MSDDSLYTLLLVDDDAQTLLVLKEHLREGPYKLLYTPKGKDALSIVLNEEPTLILLDWVMPEMDGIQTLEVLKANPTIADIPVIMFTGMHRDSPHLQQALERGAVDFLHKPFDPVELKARIANIIRLTETTKALVEMQTRERERLQEEVAAKKRELASQAMYQHEMEKLLRDIQVYMKGGEVDEDAQKTINQRIHQQLESNSWEDFQKHFEAVNPDFFQKLNTLEGKSLSPAEVKFAAYLRIGMRNNDIANLLGIGKDSLNTSLHRMKKKLDLATGESLRDFIQQL